MKTLHFFTIGVLALWMSGCSSVQTSELQNTPAPNLQATTTPVPTPSATFPSTPLTASSQDDSSDSRDAVAVIQGYYDALDRRDYEQAYRTWQDNGSASRQTFEAFKNGFADTASTQVEIDKPSPVEGAAGSQYVRVPVTLMATTQNRVVQNFKGTYVLRRSLVDGTSVDQRSWHIYSANLTQTE